MKNGEEPNEKLTTQELADLGTRLATAVSDLKNMRDDKKDAVKEMDEGIERQQKHVYYLTGLIRSGQRELFGIPVVPVEQAGKMAAKLAKETEH